MQNNKMKINAESLLAKPLDQFTYQELDVLKSFAMGSEVQRHQSRLWDQDSNKRAQEAEQRYAKKQRAIEKRKQEREAIECYITNKVKPGDLLKFTGTRNDGYRIFVRYDAKQQQVVSFVANRRYRPDLGCRVISASGYSSSNHIDFLKEHLIDPQSPLGEPDLLIVERPRPTILTREGMLKQP